MVRKKRICWRFPKTLPGFSLIEVALGLAIFGVIMGGTMRFFDQRRKVTESVRVQENQERVLLALGGYVRVHGRLPCPADPKSRGVARWDCQSPELLCGEVPYKTLGLPRHLVMGPGHRIFGYIVNPTVANRPNPIWKGGRAFCGLLRQPRPQPRNIFIFKDAETQLPDKNPPVLMLFERKSGFSGGLPYDIRTDYKIVLPKDFTSAQLFRMAVFENFVSYYVKTTCPEDES